MSELPKTGKFIGCIFPFYNEYAFRSSVPSLDLPAPQFLLFFHFIICYNCII